MRRFSYLLLAMCLCLPIVGCGDEAAKPTTPATPATSEDAGDAGSATADDGSAEKTEEAPAE